MRYRSIRLLMFVIGVIAALACSSCSRNTGRTESGKTARVVSVSYRDLGHPGQSTTTLDLSSRVLMDATASYTYPFGKLLATTELTEQEIAPFLGKLASLGPTLRSLRPEESWLEHTSAPLESGFEVLSVKWTDREVHFQIPWDTKGMPWSVRGTYDQMDGLCRELGNLRRIHRQTTKVKRLAEDDPVSKRLDHDAHLALYTSLPEVPGWLEMAYPVPFSVSASTTGSSPAGYWHLTMGNDDKARLVIDTYPKKIRRTFPVGPVQIDRLKEAIEKEQFFDLKNEYGELVPDSSEQVVRVKWGKRAKTVRILYLHNWTDEPTKLKEPARAIRVLNQIRGWFTDPEAVDLRKYDKIILDAAEK